MKWLAISPHAFQISKLAGARGSVLKNCTLLGLLTAVLSQCGNLTFAIASQMPWAGLWINRHVSPLNNWHGLILSGDA
jgi:hypothetical protein